MKITTRCLMALGLAFVLCGCQTNIDSDYYRATNVGTVGRAIRGVIISARQVKVSDESGVGATSGAAIGAIAGANGSGSDAGAAALAVAGAVVGGVVGHTTEKAITKQMAFEYVVESENGALITLVQGGPTTFAVKEQVIVLYGSPSRIIKVSDYSGNNTKAESK